jgi:hypothetical protein
MDVDAFSSASLDSAADKEGIRIKKPRATKGELAAKRAAELLQLKGVDLSLLTEAKRNTTTARIADWRFKLKQTITSTLKIRQHWFW